MPGRLTRRGALAAAALGLASCGGDEADPRPGPRPGSGVGVLNSVLALEHATVAAYSILAQLLPARERAGAEEIARQEREHVRRLAEIVSGLGGTPVAGRRPEDYRAGLPRLASARDALLLAEDLEERLVRAHLDALSKLPAGELRRTTAALATSEAEHLAMVRDLRGVAPAPHAFVTGTA